MGGLLQTICLIRSFQIATSSNQTLSATPATMNTRQVLFVALLAIAVAPAFGESKTLLLGTAVDASTNKVPLVTTLEAPCKQTCKNVCEVDLIKSCSTVPVISKVCSPTKKTESKRVCSKKCTLSVETPQVVKSLPDDTISNPNPSTPPLSNPNPSTPTAEASAAASAGRRLSGLIAADLAAKTVVAHHAKKSVPKPACDDVCETVTFEVPDMECHEVTQQTEICKMVPSNNCHQECVCISKKALALKMPKKPLDTIVSKP